MASPFIQDFSNKNMGRMDLLAGALQACFPNPDDLMTCIGVILAGAVCASWTQDQRNVLPLIIDRLRQCYDNPNDGSKNANVPLERLLEEAGFTSDHSAETLALMRMMKGADAEANTESSAHARPNGRTQRRQARGDFPG